MTRNGLNDEYFDWMCRLVSDEKYTKRRSYRKLLYLLHETEFTYSIAMDGNRYEDGVGLRYRFGYVNQYCGAMIADYLDDCPCSILEMMVALAIRLEEHIMNDPDVGDRTGQWFWGMVVSLGLGSMDDTRFERETARNVLQRFLNRNYETDGRGGLFTVKNCCQDMRTVEIWYQANWYLDSVL